MTRSVRDILWLAGLIEGEGCFGIVQGRRPVVQIKMTDEDVVKRAADILGAPLYGPYELGEGRKRAWQTSVSGPNAVQWMMTLLALMGSRRRQKIIECLEVWRTDRITSFATCHTQRAVKAGGLCGTCYNRKTGVYARRQVARRAQRAAARALREIA